MDSDRWNQRWEQRAQRRRDRHNGPHAVFVGIIIIGVGALFLLQNLGVVYVQDIWQYWPVILLALGISKLAENEWTAGLVLTVIGGVFLARNLGYIYGGVWQYLWPLIVIAAGAGLLIRGMGVGYHGPPPSAFTSSTTTSPSVETAAENRLHIHVAFSAVERRINSQEFEGGDIHVAFGAADIDLRGAQTKRAEIFLNLHAAFGGIELMVPDTWVVVLRGSGAFGVFEDKTHPVNPADPGRPRLILTGSAAFGGVTVKN
jgi:hypothetical protein